MKQQPEETDSCTCTTYGSHCSFIPSRLAQGFSVHLILIKFTVATNATHVKTLSSVLRCMYMHTHYAFVFVCVGGGVSGG